MSYALFAARKQIIDSQLMCAQLQQTQRSNEQFALATDKSDLQQKVSALSSSFSGQVAELYKKLTSTSDSSQRDSINAQISQKQAEMHQQIEEINTGIHEVSIKENAIELEVKRLNTVVSVLQNELNAIEQAEGNGIKNAIPKYAGAGG